MRSSMNVLMRLENSEQEPFLVNVDQLSRCYAGFSMDGPLQFSKVVKPRKANRRRRALVKKMVQNQQFEYQTNLKQIPTASDNVENNIDTTNMKSGPNNLVSAGINKLNKCVLSLSVKVEAN
ncbi:MAG: hypothetical protein GY816_15880, partial [Cytophagales bacterium]|nr:hypothetical protein [Cytophagales bacterium]